MNFSDYGIPTDAKILYINYTTHEIDAFPVELHGNTSTRHVIRNKITLYPVYNSQENAPDKINVSVYITWVLHDENDAFQNLVMALESYANNQFESSVIPANVSVEATLNRLLNNYLSSIIGKKRSEEFLENAATYSYQLNVILPLILHNTSLPKFSDEIRGKLNRLNKLRNQIAHNGVLDEETNKEEMAELLTAAIFGFRYLNFLNDKLLTN